MKLPASDTLSIFQARSFWLTIGMLILTGYNVGGIDAPVDPDAIADQGVQLTENVTAVVASVLGLWAYVERLFGKKRLVL